MPDKPEIIAELDETPVGANGLKKRLTAVNGENGKVYSVRAYAPRPSPGCPESYVPARGIDLTEEELKTFCIALQRNIYYFRLRLCDGSPDIKENFIDFSGIRDEQDEDREPVAVKYIEGEYEEEYDDMPAGPEYEQDLRCENLATIKTLPTDREGVVKRLSIMEWFCSCSGLKFDLREWKTVVTDTGYMEKVPVPESGIWLDDIEAEKLCMVTETLFPEILNGIEQYCEADFDSRATTIGLDLTGDELELLMTALHNEYEMEDAAEADRYERGSRVGSRAGSEYQDTLAVLWRKLSVGERVLDEECDICGSVLCRYADVMSDRATSEYMRKIDELVEKFEKIREDRENIVSARAIRAGVCYLDMSCGEAEAAAEILAKLYDKIYCESNDSIEQIREFIDGIVEDDAEARNGVSVSDKCNEGTPGERFFEDLIDACEIISDI